MKLDLPNIIERYFASDNASDLDGLAACFTADATVRDEGKTHRGTAAIKRWMGEAKAKYQHTTAPLSIEPRGGRTVVTAEVSGRFPGSPVRLAYDFDLDGDRIASLEIHP